MTTGQKILVILAVIIILYFISAYFLGKGIMAGYELGKQDNKMKTSDVKSTSDVEKFFDQK